MNSNILRRIEKIGKVLGVAGIIGGTALAGGAILLHRQNHMLSVEESQPFESASYRNMTGHDIDTRSVSDITESSQSPERVTIDAEDLAEGSSLAFFIMGAIGGVTGLALEQARENREMTSAQHTVS